jgi:anti-sigma regulatory factor (Ser/Thr protein kinase)
MPALAVPLGALIVLISWFAVERFRHIRALRKIPAAHCRYGDSGIPFDPRSVPKPDIDRLILSRRTGGLGIYLARTLMDGFDYRREDGQNVLTLTKKK